MENKLDSQNLYLFNEGTYYNAFESFGSHPQKDGTLFNVWCPDARSVFVLGDFSNWNEMPEYELHPADNSGVWTGFFKDIKEGYKYKYSITSSDGRKLPLKADPFAFCSEKRPGTASVVWNLDYKWHDQKWLEKRNSSDHFRSAKNIYEVHLGSWKRNPLPENATQNEKDNNFYTYEQIADELIPYVKDMGYTHIEIMPVMEHPFDGSWGYQTMGYYAASSRYGTPQGLKHLIDTAHRAGIGVILDWVAGHFCLDDPGLARFNGSMLYENEVHPNWGTGKFDFGRPQVRSFLLSNAMFWLKEYHADGIRVDGVSSMLYLNFGVDDPKLKKLNKFGNEGNLEAIDFLKALSSMVGKYCPGTMLIAEESTAWPLVTKPPEDGGLGFHYKWDMGWMHDTLNYMKTDFPYREGAHSLLTFSIMYTFSENFILPFSHDEVVHGKASLIGRMPGDTWRQFAGLRSLALYQMTHNGGKLNFMGNEIAQFIEWRFYEGIEFCLTEQFENHKKHQDFIRDLNRLYKKEAALWLDDTSPESFRWIDADNAHQSVLSYVRSTKDGKEKLICLINFGTDQYDGYRIGVPEPGRYHELISSDSEKYGGNGHINKGIIRTEDEPFHGMPYSVCIRIPSLGGLILKKKLL